jgi:NADH-quinone oxidoreductase subunit L
MEGRAAGRPFLLPGGTMFDGASLILLLGLVTGTAPVLLLCALGLPSLLGRKLSERTTDTICQAATVTGLLASLAVLALMLLRGTRREAIELGEWVAIPHYHFSVKLVFDRLSVPMAILSFVLCGTIAAFAARYMHRERGYNRFFVLYALFVVGMVVTALAGTIETLFAGWELVGLSSALLVAYFQERPAPVQNGLRVWAVYRVSDAALLLAAVAIHRLEGAGDLGVLLGAGPWPEGRAAVSAGAALWVGLLLVVAAAGKSALVPFSGWLPRAMEGPTPSSAVFYGALSAHLGAYLLLRAGPLLETSVWLSGTVVVLGLATAVYAYLVGSVQTDIKSALAFASLVQVGLIVAEIGLGFRYVALVHLLGHACLRTLQFIRAPTLLHDYHLLERAIGEHLPRFGAPLPMAGLSRAGRVRGWLYRFALERGCLDALLARYVVAPFTRLFRWCDATERRWTNLLTPGGVSRESDLLQPRSGGLEDLP